MGTPASRSLLISLIVACALFMENLDSTVLATALPSIAASLGEVPLRLNLGITSYLFSLAVFIPVSGWMADRFGARSVFCTAIIIFSPSDRSPAGSAARYGNSWRRVFSKAWEAR